MPWCPICRSEYRPGVTRCTSCGEILVERLSDSSQRAPLEERTPDDPAAYLWELSSRLLRALERTVWPDIRWGARILSIALRRSLRLRNLWLFLLAIALMNGTWCLSDGRRLYSERLAYDYAGLSSLSPSAALWLTALSVPERWAYWPRLGSSLSEGVREPFRYTRRELTFVLRFPASHWLMPALQQTSGTPAYWALWLWQELVGAIVAAFLTGALCGWILAGLRGRHLSLRVFARSAWRNFHPLFGWGVVVIALTASSHALAGLVEARSSMVDDYTITNLRASALGLVTLVLALSPFAIVIRSTGTFAGVAHGLRILRTRWPALLVVFLSYRITYAVIETLSSMLGSLTIEWCVPPDHVPAWSPLIDFIAGSGLAGVSILNCLRVAAYALGAFLHQGLDLILAVALILILLRPNPQPRASLGAGASPPKPYEAPAK